MSLRDYLIDGAAATLLLWAFGLPWAVRPDQEYSFARLQSGGDLWWVLLAIIAALVSLAVPYAHRAGLLGALDSRQARLLKLALMGPALISVVINLLFTAINGNGDDAMTGVGGGVVVICGALVLVALPRSYEAESEAGTQMWRKIGLGLVAAGVVLGLVSTLINIIDSDLLSSDSGDLIIVLMLFYVLPFLAVTVLPLVRAAQNTFAGVTLLCWVGGTTVGHQILADFGNSSAFAGGIATFTHAAVVASFLIAAGGLVFLSDSLVSRSTSARTVQGWFQVAGLSALLTAITAGCIALSSIVALVDDAGDQGKVIALLVMSLLIAAAAGVSVNLVRQQPGSQRPAVVGMAALSVVFGIVAIVMNHQGGGPGQVPWTGTAGFLILPVLTAFALTVPKIVRDELGPILTVAQSSPADTQQ